MVQFSLQAGRGICWTSQSDVFYEPADNERYNMAVEDGLFPLVHLKHTHTHVSTAVQIFLINQSTQKKKQSKHLTRLPQLICRVGGVL